MPTDLISGPCLPGRDGHVWINTKLHDEQFSNVVDVDPNEPLRIVCPFCCYMVYFPSMSAPPTAVFAPRYVDGRKAA